MEKVKVNFNGGYYILKNNGNFVDAYNLEEQRIGRVLPNLSGNKIEIKEVEEIIVPEYYYCAAPGSLDNFAINVAREFKSRLENKKLYIPENKTPWQRGLIDAISRYNLELTKEFHKNVRFIKTDNLTLEDFGIMRNESGEYRDLDDNLVEPYQYNERIEKLIMETIPEFIDGENVHPNMKIN